MDRADYLRKGEEAPRAVPLVVLVLLLAASGTFLYEFVGPPHLPAQIPGWTEILVTLEGSDVPLNAFAYVFTTVSWLLWIWITASLLIRLLVAGAEIVSHGSAWAVSLRAATDRFTLPVVRKIVDGAVVAVLVVNLVARTPAASAAPLETPVAAAVLHTTPGLPNTHGSVVFTASETSASEVEYTVQPGDTLWSIAQHFYGTGEEFPRLVEANAGRRMPDGRVFTRAGVIQPGWVLRVPLPSKAITRDGQQTYYLVEKGDTLRGIAARLLGDENRWPTIYDLNRGTARLADGHVLNDPDLIWPGLRLRLPESQTQPARPAAPVSPITKPVPTHHVQPAEPRSQPTPVAPTPIHPVAPTPVVVPSVTPRPTPAPVVQPSRASETNPLSTVEVDGAIGLAVVALGGGVWLARRRVRRNLGDRARLVAPVHLAPRDDFADAGFARALAYRLQTGGVEPATAAAARILHFLATHGIKDVAVVFAQLGAKETTLVLRAPLHDADKLQDLSDELERWLGGKVAVQTTPDHDVMLRSSGAAIGAVPAIHADRASGSLSLLAFGLLSNGDTVFANWPELGHVIVAGLPGGGVSIVLTSLLCALAARYRPDELHLYTVASRRCLPERIADFPHQVAGIVSTNSEDDITDVMEEVRAELLHRMSRRDRDPSWSWRPDPDSPEIVLVAGEFDDLIDDGTTLELIGTHGPALGVRLVVGSTRSDGIRDEFLAHFTTRLVLQTSNDDESIALLGRPDAAEIGNAELFLRLGSRIPLRLRGFQVSDAGVEELIRLMADRRSDPGARAVNREGAAMDDPHNREGNQPDVAPIDDLSSGGSPVALTDDSGDELEEIGPDDPGLPIDGKDGSRVPVQAAIGSANEAHGVAMTEAMPTGIDSQLNGHANGHQKGVESRSSSPDTSHSLDVGRYVNSGSGIPTGPSDGDSKDDRPRLYIRCLGDFAVLSGDREVTPNGGEEATYQGWEVLAFLAIHPNGEVSKDRLLATLWPDVPVERATKRMHAALVRLRPLLIQQVPGLTGDFVRADRDGIVRLDPKLAVSDAQEFLDLVRQAEKRPPHEALSLWERARELYRGDLLTGRGARFYDWVDERTDDGTTIREQFRDAYDQATRRLAELYCREGHPEFAVPLYRALLKSEPTLEDVVRDLFRCYGQLGDLPSLLREERSLRQALRAAYTDPDDPDDDPDDYQPEPETTELFKEIRAKMDGNARREHVNGRSTSPPSRVHP